VVTKWYHSPSLAAKSKYIDALLAAPMKESESRTITFPDISPETWELMIKFVDDPVASRSMKAEDVPKVAKYYDKYEFTGGTSLCDIILTEYFRAVKDPFKAKSTIPAPDVDFCVNSVVLAHEANLGKAFKQGMDFIWIMMRRTIAPAGRTMFSEDHMKKLAPLLEGTKHESWQRRATAEKYDFKSDTFPKEFVRFCSDWLTFDNINRFVHRIRLTGSTCTADGDFSGHSQHGYKADDERTVEWKGVLQNVCIELRDEKGWAIILKTIPPLDEDGDPDYDSIVETVAWRAPYSGNMHLPPSNGWVSVHPLARGDIKLTYVLMDEAEVW